MFTLMLIIAFSIPIALIITGLCLNKRTDNKTLGKRLIGVGSGIIISLITFILFIFILLISKHPVFFSVVVLLSAILLILTILATIRGLIKKKIIYIPLIISVCIIGVVTGGFSAYQNYIDNIPTVGEGNELLKIYSPYTDGTCVATLDETSTLQITENIPRMNGATAMYPIYSAFARAVYPKYTLEHITTGNDYHSDYCYLSCNTTAYAYSMIVDKEADIIFVGAPSEEQEQYAKENGVELVYTPIGKEAFVFFVNSQNPISDITLDNIRDVYSGEITKWNQLGVEGFGDIRAFQREEGSGSQSALYRLMGDTPVISPPTENVVWGMGGIIEKTADYKNYRNALGYSFRFYSTDMVKNSQIKLLSVNGVYPSLENIENGTYPITSTFYAVTRSDADDNTKALVEWILGPQGQELIEKTGYTPLY